MSFRLQLASIPADGLRYEALRFTVDHHEDGKPDRYFNPVYAPAIGEYMEYGNLFAYLFRRFGYPNRGWDGYKELVKYLLSTPRADMFLGVVPYVGGDTELTFHFYAPSAAAREGERYVHRMRETWEQRALAHREETGLPDWLPTWVAHCRDELFPTLGLSDSATPSWREALRYASFGQHALRKQAKHFAQELFTCYERIEPRPNEEERPANLADWADDDPLKPYALAAAQALADLTRPVRVRDCAIDVFGDVPHTSRTLKEPPVAGYACGVLGNLSPKAFVELHGLIVQLGKGDGRRGLAKAVDALKRELGS